LPVDCHPFSILGLLVNAAEQKWHLFSAGELEVFEFLADIGIICLLFRVGLESKLAELIGQLRRASIVWLGNVSLSGLLGFFTAYFFLQLEMIPSLFVGTAMTATSVGISVGIWREAKAINSPNGELMLDVAEMDDISAVILMALLFAVAPVLRSQPDATLLPVLVNTATAFFFKALVFGAFCFLFSRYGEQSLTSFFQRLEPPPDSTIMVAGVGFIIAALAGLLGFSVAIGAFFAGLVFCRDPDAIKIDASFDTFYELFVPFFFLGIGLKIDLDALATALDLGIILLIVAVVGKVVGVAIPVLKLAEPRSAILLGISMVPRAEIMMIVMQHGLQLGEWAVPVRVFAAMVLVSAATTIVVPLVLRPLLRQWPQTEGRSP
jgi:Kef-type K+ transport system membrane component KefB